MKPHLFFVLICFTLLPACKKDKIEPAPDVYVSGYETNIDNKAVAKIWKNGKVIHVLTDGTSHGIPTSMFITPQGDIYSAGYVVISNTTNSAQVWKNNQPSVFLTRVGSSYAGDIFVNEDIYVAGEMNSRAVIWKNGDYSYLTNGTYVAGLSCIHVDNGDVYVGGYERNAEDRNIAKIWKNGTPTILSSNPGYIEDIYVADGVVYAVGREWSSTASKLVAKIWKNGVATSLTDGVANASASGVTVVGTDVYVVGYDGNFGKIWKNGIGTTLSVAGANVSDVVGKSVAVHGNDVYVAGSYVGPVHGSPYGTHGVLWKNGEEIPLEINDKLKNSNVYDVIVR